MVALDPMIRCCSRRRQRGWYEENQGASPALVPAPRWRATSNSTLPSATVEPAPTLTFGTSETSDASNSWPPLNVSSEKPKSWSNETPAKIYGATVEKLVPVKVMPVFVVKSWNPKPAIATVAGPVLVSVTSNEFPVEPASAASDGTDITCLHAQA
jgi:hypothetical protein